MELKADRLVIQWNPERQQYDVTTTYRDEKGRCTFIRTHVGLTWANVLEGISVSVGEYVEVD